jgi:hypothetical protein
MWPVTLPGSWVASTTRRKDAGSADRPTIGATEDAPARRVIAGQGPGERCRLHHYVTGQSIVIDGGNIVQEPHGIDLYGGA